MADRMRWSSHWCPCASQAGEVLGNLMEQRRCRVSESNQGIHIKLAKLTNSEMTSWILAFPSEQWESRLMVHHPARKVECQACRFLAFFFFGLSHAGLKEIEMAPCMHISW